MSHSIQGRAQLAKKGLPKLSFQRILSGQPLAESWHPPRSPETHLTYPHQIHPEGGCCVIPGTTLASPEEGI